MADGPLSLSSDAFLVWYAQRFSIVIAVAMLFLAVMRRLLPHGVAWMLAAWLCTQRVNYDVLVEVHLFSFIPLLAAVLVSLSGRG